MNDPNLYRAQISPLPADCTRPLWSVMIPTYNCADLLRQTLAGVLAQDPGADLMQIAVVDDGSTRDDPAAVVAELGQGRVEFYRQPENVGYIRNFATCLQQSRGHLVHLLHGDDGVMDSFYTKMQRLFRQYPAMGAAFCRHIIMDEQGHWKYFSQLEQPESGLLNNWLERIASELPLQPPSMVVRRSVYEHLGGFDQRLLSCGEDWEMWVRIAVHYPVGYEPEPLAFYRDRDNSLTKGAVRTGQNIRDVQFAAEIVRSYLPEAVADRLANQARESWALWGLYCAEQLLLRGDSATAAVQIRAGLSCWQSWRVMRTALPLLLQLTRPRLSQTVQPLKPGKPDFAELSN